MSARSYSTRAGKYLGMGVLFWLLGSNCALASTDADPSASAGLIQTTDVLFLLIGAVMILAMHGGFAFLEAGGLF